MEKLVIEGGKPLKGEVEISGAKNSCLPIMAASLLTDEPCVIRNVPPLRDIHTMIKLLKALGIKAEWSNYTVFVEPRVKQRKYIAPYQLVKTMRASVCVLGPLLSKLHRAKVSLPGGCVIGHRPIDLHLKGLSALGGEISIEHGYVVAKAKQLKGARIYLGGPFGSSVLGTANVMMAAVLAKGKTLIENAASEPEIIDLANFLLKMGAKIKGIATHILEIEGVKELKGADYSVIPDRIEAGTYMIAGAITGGDIRLKSAQIEHLGAVIDKLQEAGVEITLQREELRVSRRGKLRPVEVTTLPYPGFPTDMQAQMMSLMTVTEGISVITEKIYPDRFMHVAELNRMGAEIMLEGASAIVKGVKKLSGAPVMASDLRASAALVLAGLVAKGKTEISRIYHLDRGYEAMEKKLAKLGARIWRVKE
ncbi:MAG: UDP-N-acetylglucosamine 1-carboxyvinyltransferase [Candidatus Omnitrophica bacterium]|nr:UDP-N-acetylglucosamine 1-carboxyvinyltransferase [Candidatus Omnitrophota bacterium]MCM8798102.1 UDP-N-acetylglucosamine 1-carboxyvinyltransferase [Candidatus Omnitrophota bacterium]